MKSLLCPSTAIGLALLGAGCSGANGSQPDGSPDGPDILVGVADASLCKGTLDAPAPSNGQDPLCATTAPTVSFAKDVAPILSGTTCSGEICHAPWQYNTLVNQRSYACCDHRYLIEPGQPSSSHVIQAVTGHGMCVDPMPLGGKLPDATIATLIAWVCQGALNN